MRSMEVVKELLYKLNGVEFVHVTENLSLEYDKKSALPGASFKVYVKGGKKKEIADVIFMHKPFGYMSIGNTRVKLNYGGFEYHIRFERLF